MGYGNTRYMQSVDAVLDNFDAASLNCHPDVQTIIANTLVCGCLIERTERHTKYTIQLARFA